MNKNKIVILFSISLLLLLFSCTSEAGETGNENDVRFFSEKKTIYSVLKKHYVGFDTMVGRGFTKQAWEQTSDYDEVRALFDKCINDTPGCVSYFHLWFAGSEWWRSGYDQIRL